MRNKVLRIHLIFMWIQIRRSTFGSLTLVQHVILNKKTITWRWRSYSTPASSLAKLCPTVRHWGSQSDPCRSAPTRRIQGATVFPQPKGSATARRPCRLRPYPPCLREGTFINGIVWNACCKVQLKYLPLFRMFLLTYSNLLLCPLPVCSWGQGGGVKMVNDSGGK